MSAELLELLLKWMVQVMYMLDNANLFPEEERKELNNRTVDFQQELRKKP